MAQINLLKQNSSSGGQWKVIPKISAQLLGVALVVLVAYYGWLVYSINKDDKDISAIQTQVSQGQQAALNTPGRDELLTRQQQLQDFGQALASHVYFSQLLPQLAASTLKQASYSSLEVGTNEQLSLTVNVPDLASIDKYLQVFNLPEVNKYFSNVRIGSYNKVQNGNSTSVTFNVTMDYNQALISYVAPQGSTGQ